MAAEEINIPCGKYDWLRAQHAQGGHKDLLVVMIHGFPGDSRSYANVFGDLSTQLEDMKTDSVRFDMRGCGQSERGATFFSIRTAAEDSIYVIQWAQKLGYKKFALVAEGLGAAVAMTILSDALRSRVAGMLLLWPILIPRESWLGTASDPALFGETLTREIRGYDFAALMPRVTMPTLALCGSADTKAPPATQAEALRARATGNNLEIVSFDGGDHGLKTATERQALLAQSRDFFRKIA